MRYNTVNQPEIRMLVRNFNHQRTTLMIFCQLPICEDCCRQASKRLNAFPSVKALIRNIGNFNCKLLNFALGRAWPDAGARLRQLHRAAGDVPQGPGRPGQGEEEEVRQADGKVLREPGALPRPLHQEAGQCAAGGKCWTKPRESFDNNRSCSFWRTFARQN